MYLVQRLRRTDKLKGLAGVEMALVGMGYAGYRRSVGQCLLGLNAPIHVRLQGHME